MITFETVGVQISKFYNNPGFDEGSMGSDDGYTIFDWAHMLGGRLVKILLLLVALCILAGLLFIGGALICEIIKLLFIGGIITCEIIKFLRVTTSLLLVYMGESMLAIIRFWNGNTIIHAIAFLLSTHGTILNLYKLKGLWQWGIGGLLLVASVEVLYRCSGEVSRLIFNSVATPFTVGDLANILNIFGSRIWYMIYGLYDGTVAIISKLESRFVNGRRHPATPN